MPGARLSLEEREEIALGIASGRSLTGIARGGRSSGLDRGAGGRAERWSPPLPGRGRGACDTPAGVPPEGASSRGRSGARAGGRAASAVAALAAADRDPAAP